MLKRLFARILSKQAAKLAGMGVGTLLAAIGGLTSVKSLQPVVERASDYAAKTVELYCELPLVDRERFRAEVHERLGEGYAVRVDCLGD